MSENILKSKQYFPSPYPNTLFHFTNSKGLTGILTDMAFKLRYSTEKLGHLEDVKYLSIPMVSFCDLRMTELPYHMSKYDEYGIGLTKSWALQSGLNPVSYVNQHSSYQKTISKLLKELRNYVVNDYKKESGGETSDDEKIHRESLEKIYQDSHEAWLYMKNYEDTLERKGITHHNYRFADEREWRYVLPPNNGNVPRVFVGEGAPIKMLNELYANRIAENLKFNVEDVKYIIVPNQDEAEKFRLIITDNLKERNNLVKNLSSLIITAEQIKEDM